MTLAIRNRMPAQASATSNQTGGGLDHDAVVENRYADQPQQQYGKIGGELLQRWDQKIAERYHETQEQQRKGDQPADREAEQGKGDRDCHADERRMFEKLNLARAPQEPEQRKGQ